mmetsp:Transcript_37946/g.121761  ORF Transcript_37946/g.121761 Transcript_37946/m.121761 type:complete len:254 (+) Transcript_37946:480-1241(+)
MRKKPSQKRPSLVGADTFVDSRASSRISWTPTYKREPAQSAVARSTAGPSPPKDPQGTASPRTTTRTMVVGVARTKRAAATSLFVFWRFCFARSVPRADAAKNLWTRIAPATAVSLVRDDCSATAAPSPTECTTRASVATAEPSKWCKWCKWCPAPAAALRLLVSPPPPLFPSPAPTDDGFLSASFPPAEENRASLSPSSWASSSTSSVGALTSRTTTEEEGPTPLPLREGVDDDDEDSGRLRPNCSMDSMAP